MSWTLLLAIIFFLSFLIVSVVVIIYIFLGGTRYGKSCNSSQDCTVNQRCENNICVNISCQNDNDCVNARCHNSQCINYQCNIGNDCPVGMACVNNACVEVITGTGMPASCTSNEECGSLSCMNQQCVQCITDDNCPTGMGCFDNTCRYPQPNIAGINTITYPSTSAERGNVNGVPAYFCSIFNCGTGPGNLEPIPCPINACPPTCPYCVNSLCRCTSGELYETCNINSDCQSGICDNTIIGRVCIPSGGECAFNYNGVGGEKVCPVSRPYCANGICNTGSLGAICGGVNMPIDLCNNPRAIGVVGVTGTSSDNMGMFCVDGICQQNVGNLNDRCTFQACGDLTCDGIRCVI